MSATAAPKPVILLAYANDPADGYQYLRNLPQEARQVRAALEYAEAQGLCEFELRYNATLDDILGAFQHPKLKGRIAVFHYGGHADSYELLFQSAEGNLQRIDGRGFAAFLAEQRSLQLVFLNACSTEPQVEGLLAANVQVVIATVQEVEDGAAAALAGGFYHNLARGDSIGSAYRQAVAALRAQKGDDPALFYAVGSAPPAEISPAVGNPAGAEGGSVGDGEGSSDGGSEGVSAAGVSAAGVSTPGGYWPWRLRTRPGAEDAVEWSLPLAAGDPLFGLPLLPPRPLPADPYQRALDYYTRDLAELFFGRSRQIRDLYQRVTAAGRASIILYYGQSGVGKSSLLDAGLAPRLAATHQVAYARRDRTLGLLGTLHRQLAVETGGTGETEPTPPPVPTTPVPTTPVPTTPVPTTPVPTTPVPTTPVPTTPVPTPPASPPPSLAAAWLAAEQALGRPLVLILDQVEEVFTRRSPDLPHELEEFAAALRSIDAAGSPKPAGVLILGFRKERLAELETALRTESLDFAKVYLAPLDRQGIEEIFWGPVRSPRLAAKYALTVEETLPPLVAQDLTADPDAPVAPTLNILLRKLWAAATAAHGSAPVFSVALYEQLRREGILLDDFLRQQIATLTQEQPAAANSGFLLDLWAMHTTDLGTAEQCEDAELRAAYGHRTDLDVVMLRSKELYVLADPTGDRATGGASRLAHDTLAPLVRRAHAQSTLPAQQARRLLDSRVALWQGDPQALLDDMSLTLVEKGLPGTCAPSPAERQLLTQSQEARAARKRNRQLLLWAGAAAALLLLAMLGLTLQSRADQQQANAASTQIAVTATIAAELNRAETAKLNAQATAVAASAEGARAQAAAQNLSTQLADARARSAALLAEASDAQRLAELSTQQLTVDPVLSLHLALAALPASPGQVAAPQAEYALRQAVFTSRERKFITTTVESADQIALRGNRVAVGGAAPGVYDIELSPQLFPLPPEFVDVRGLRWGNDGRLLGWTARAAWITGGGEPLHFALDTVAPARPDEEIRCAEWQPAQQWVAICTFDTLYAWQPQTGRVVTVTTALDTLEAPTEPRRALWSSDGRYLAGSGARLAVWDSRAPRTPAQIFYAPAAPGEPLSFAFWTPDDTALVAGWFVPGAAELSIQRWQPSRAELETIRLAGTFSPDAKVEARLWVKPAEDIGGGIGVGTGGGTADRTADRTGEETGGGESEGVGEGTEIGEGPQDTARLLLWASDGLLALYSLSGERLATTPAPLRDLNDVVLAPDGERIAGYSSSGAAAIWSLPDLSLYATLNPNDGFAAGPLTHAAWLDNDTLALADAEGVIRVTRRSDPFGELAIVRLDGYSPSDHLAGALRLANGRLLTAAYGDGGVSSLRIWQIDPRATLRGEGLPRAGSDLCEQVHRAVTLPPGLGRPTVEAWGEGDKLLVVDAARQVAAWQIGGGAAILPADPDRYLFAFAPDQQQVLRYGSGTTGEIWRLAEAPGEETAAQGEETGPAEGETAPAGGETAVAGGATAPGGSETAPAEQETAPGGAETAPASWKLARTLEGELEGAAWNEHGILASYRDGTAAVIDPATGRRSPAPEGISMPGSILLDDTLLLALRTTGVELWRLHDRGEHQRLAVWPSPSGEPLVLDDAAVGADLFALRTPLFGIRYLLRLDPTTATLAEVWRSTRPHVDTGTAKLNPTRPLLATLDDGVVTVVDWEQGRVVWQSSSVATLAQQSVRAVQWSTDGEYLITQAQPLQQGSVSLKIGVWRWEEQQQRLVLLQETPSSGLLGVSPDMTAILAGGPGQEEAPTPYFYPVLSDTARLKTEVEGSCLLPRPLGEEQQQAFMVMGR